MTSAPPPDLAIGSVTVHRVIDMDPFVLPLRTIFPEASLAALEGALGDLAPLHLDVAREAVQLAVQSHLVRIDGRTILVDTCVGEHKPRPRRAEWNGRSGTSYLANLARCGVRPEEIDMVMCTHLHVDHVGWNTRLEDGRWVPTFPKARYVVAADELAFLQREVAINPEVGHGCYADSVLPLLEADRIDPVSADAPLAEHARLVPLPGHTPGQVGLEIAEPGQTALLFCGDAIHSPVQVVRPDWSSAFCHDPRQAQATRAALIERAETTDTVLVPAHLRAPGLRVGRHGGRHRPLLCGCDGRVP